MNRRDFVVHGFRAACLTLSADSVYASVTAPGLAPITASPNTPQGTDATPPKIMPMLYGTPREDTNLEAWFQSMHQWGVRRWMVYMGADRPCYEGLHCEKPASRAPFLENAWPGFTSYVGKDSLTSQEKLIRRQEQLCAEHGIEFWCVLPFPIFPSFDGAVVRKTAPEFFPSGRLNLYQPRIRDLLKAEVRALKKALPGLKGVNLWLAEGAPPGLQEDVVADEIKNNKKWEPPLIAALNDVCGELGITGVVFAHHYLDTVETRRNVYEMMTQFPELFLMEDITWPEEDMLHPFIGYLPPQDRELLFSTNPVSMNFLLDTEYIGEGILPSVYPRWWKHNIAEAVRAGTTMAMGRTFFWDGGRTDVNFNRLNACIFTRLCYDPKLELYTTLQGAAREMFGAGIPQRLIDILWETELVVKEVVGINGVDSFDHSRFPRGIYLDALYTGMSNGMKAVDDLFSPPGTRLYPPLTGDLNNFKQWRWQNKTISKPASAYLAKKKAASDWARRALPEVLTLSAGLEKSHRELFAVGYESLAAAASGMELFVEAAALHYAWGRGKTVSDAEARKRFTGLAGQFRKLAAQTPQTALSYKERMMELADFLEQDLPRISTNTRCSGA